MNSFKQGLADQQPLVGLWQALANPYSAEICAGAGFDWLLFDGEHAPNDVPLILAQLQAVAAYPVEAVVRLSTGDPVLIKQILDIGAKTILIPMVEDREQAEALVRACHYPPRGVRGVGSAISRAGRWNRTADYLKTASEEVCLLVQIESKVGLDNIEEIAGVDGVSGIFIGPSDLAAALGYLGRASDAVVGAAIEDAIKRVRRVGKPVGILMADIARARHYLELGCTFIAIGTDVGILARGAEDLAQALAGHAGAR